MLWTALVLGAISPAAQMVVDALGEKDCPRLYALITPPFQAAVPAANWPGFCNAVGKVTQVEQVEDREGWPTYRAVSASGTWDLRIAFDKEGRVAGLSAAPWHEGRASLPAELKGVLDALGEPDCPRLFGMLTPSFQTAVPAPKWPSFCNGIGKVSAASRVADRDGWPTYRAVSATGSWELRIAFDKGGRVSGLRADSWRKTLAANSLKDALAQAGEANEVPGMAALQWDAAKGAEQAEWGVRRLGEATPVGPADRWHLGSDTKAMTATMVATFVEAGKLAWSTTVASAFPDWEDIHPDYAQVTLEELLTHRGGLPKDVPEPVWGNMWKATEPVGARREAVHALLRLAPAGKRGNYLYANAGYMTAALMAERLSRESWETLMKKRVFAPLGMTSCGFGPPASSGKTDSPWAHVVKDGKLTPIAPGPESDNPASLGPAGTVHCSLDDWAKFVAAQMAGEAGEKTPLGLSAATFQKLHQPAEQNYAMGWGVMDPPWAGGRAWSHDGSNQLFYASVVAVPAKRVAFFVVANRGDERGQTAVHEVLGYLADRWAKQR